MCRVRPVFGLLAVSLLAAAPLDQPEPRHATPATPVVLVNPAPGSRYYSTAGITIAGETLLDGFLIVEVRFQNAICHGAIANKHGRYFEAKVRPPSGEWWPGRYKCVVIWQGVPVDEVGFEIVAAP